MFKIPLRAGDGFVTGGYLSDGFASGGYLSFFGERKVPAGGRHADLSTNFLCEETGIYTDEK